MNISNKSQSIITKKLVKDLTVIPFLIGIATFGISFWFLNFYQATSLAFIFFAIAGFAEHARRQSKAKFSQISQEFHAFRINLSKTFLDYGRLHFGNKWKIGTEFTTIKGIKFAKITGDKPFPLAALHGPFCPKCGKRLSINLSFFVFVISAFKYNCLCGFKKFLKTDPITLYMQACNYFNIEVMDPPNIAH